MPGAFPEFQPLSPDQRPHIESHAAKFPPYSDFNFTSLYCWDTKGEAACSTLNGNLVVRFTDYLTGEPFYSFLGGEQANETAHALLEQMRAEGRAAELKLVPHVTATALDPKQFEITEDPRNHDYILSVDRLATYAGKTLGPKRNFVNRFKKLHRWETRLLDLTDTETQQRMIALFHLWAERKGAAPADTENEYRAISRLFLLAGSKPLLAVGIYVDNTLAGFTVNERVSEDHAVLHFEKADAHTYIGIYQMLMLETARVLQAQGVHWLNYEQDLGIAGLEKAKRSFDPASFLQKYRVTWRRPS